LSSWLLFINIKNKMVMLMSMQKTIANELLSCASLIPGLLTAAVRDVLEFFKILSQREVFGKQQLAIQQ